MFTHLHTFSQLICAQAVTVGVLHVWCMCTCDFVGTVCMMVKVIIIVVMIVVVMTIWWWW